LFVDFSIQPKKNLSLASSLAQKKLFPITELPHMQELHRYQAKHFTASDNLEKFVEGKANNVICLQTNYHSLQMDFCWKPATEVMISPAFVMGQNYEVFNSISCIKGRL
jgi:hypothetical protein